MLVSYCANFAPQGQNSRLCAAARRSHCSHSQYHSCSNYCSRLNTIPVPTQVIMLVSYCANFAPQGQNSRLCAAARRSHCSHSQYRSCSNYCSRLNTIPVPTQVIMLVSYCAAARRSYCSHSPLCSLVKPLLIPPFPTGRSAPSPLQLPPSQNFKNRKFKNYFFKISIFFRILNLWK